MLAIDRMYFDKYSVDPEGEEIFFDLSAEGWHDSQGDIETEHDGLYDEDWPDMA